MTAAAPAVAFGCRAQFAVVLSFGFAALLALAIADSLLYGKTKDLIVASSAFATADATAARFDLVNGTGLPTNVNVTVTYRVENGLFNQFFAHMSALMTARMVGAELVLPFVMSRKTFNVTDVKANTFVLHEPSWLLDVDGITRRCEGMGVHVEPGWPEFIERLYPTGERPEYRYQHEPTLLGKMNERDDLLPVVINNLPYRTLSLSQLHAKMRSRMVESIDRRVESGRNLSAVERVIFFLGNPMYAINVRESRKLAQEAFAAIRFAPHLAAVASRALRELRLLAGPAAGPFRAARFNAVHLRLEPDSNHWVQDFGGYDALKASYRLYMDEAGFDTGTPLYVSTALTSPEFAEQWLSARREVLDGRGSPVVFKEALLGGENLADLDPEQLAVIDYLVATQATRFVGFARSSFSLILSQQLFLTNAEKTMLIPPENFLNTPYFAGGLFTDQSLGLPE